MDEICYRIVSEDSPLGVVELRLTNLRYSIEIIHFLVDRLDVIEYDLRSSASDACG
jgi:hypothetical protein